ncbi:MAG TPA: DUF2283 domain-containing protein [Acidimicrobiales bacterium]|nr:DUF2283 domain-containing protein [Acidimicrobiales bacterium]
MRYEYDAHSDALYIVLLEATPDHQVEMDDGTIVDVTSDGRVRGVDVMIPSGGWDAEAIIERWSLDAATAGTLRLMTNFVFSITPAVDVGL